MENNQTIDQYIASNMDGKIVKRAKSPLLGIIILAVGIGLLVLMSGSQLSDSLQALMLTLGVLALGLGVVLTAMSLSRALWHWQYQPTHSRMNLKKVYLTVADLQHTVDALGRNDVSALASLQPVVSSNSVLHVLYSRDHSIALLQAGHMDTGHFEPATPVVQLSGTEFAGIKVLCK